jgi:hypothetical protein
VRSASQTSTPSMGLLRIYHNKNRRGQRSARCITRRCGCKRAAAVCQPGLGHPAQPPWVSCDVCFSSDATDTQGTFRATAEVASMLIYTHGPVCSGTGTPARRQSVGNTSAPETMPSYWVPTKEAGSRLGL